MIAEKKGMGMIGVFMILAFTLFFFTMFYIVLYMMFTNFLPLLTTSDSTKTYYDSTLLPIMTFMPFLFLLSVVLWGIIQSQNEWNMVSILGIWVVILFSFFTVSTIFMALDEYIMSTLPNMFTLDANYAGVYNNLVKNLWRTIPVATPAILFIFGLYMASSYSERAGKTYSGGYITQ